jgi:hypothetical protein
MQVQGGFILGFDSDDASVFDNLIQFIQNSGIVMAMVGLLNAPRGTKLYKRLFKEQRLTIPATGNNTDCSINFAPKMGMENLVLGYRRVIQTIYSQKHYCDGKSCSGISQGDSDNIFTKALLCTYKDISEKLQGLFDD